MHRTRETRVTESYGRHLVAGGARSLTVLVGDIRAGLLSPDKPRTSVNSSHNCLHVLMTIEARLVLSRHNSPPTLRATNVEHVCPKLLLLFPLALIRTFVLSVVKRILFLHALNRALEILGSQYLQWSLSLQLSLIAPHMMVLVLALELFATEAYLTSELKFADASAVGMAFGRR
eukprot:4293717-Amphidinium_carterae.4